MTEIPDAALRARQMYVDGASTRDIEAQTGVTRTALYRWIDGGGGLLPPIARRSRGRRNPGRKSGRAALIRRIMRAAELQVKQIGKRLAEDGVPPTERERQTRSLAVLAKTIRELVALEAAETQAQAEAQKTQDNDGSFPSDIEQLRRELTQRLEQMHRGGSGGNAGGA
jgi:DNA-binding transcriptional MerR regulator